jgi:putative membrane protein
VRSRSFRDQLDEHPLLLAFAAAYLIEWTVYGFAVGADATLAYLITVVAVIALVMLLDQRVAFSPWILWALAVWGFAHMAGGLVPFGDGVLYNADLAGTVIHYDRVVHALGFGVATVACWETLVALNPGVVMTPGTAVLAALMGMGVGAANEVVEFAASHLFASNVGGYENTGWDLVANLLGCTVAATALYVCRR